MRCARVLIQGARYHITARTNNRLMHLEPAEIKRLFIRTLTRAKMKYHFSVENFCLMGNHIHLILRPGRKESLSKIMQWLLGVFAMAFNRLMGSCGHVWGDRFFSRPILSRSDFVSVFRYIDENPAAAGLCADSRNWEYSGHFFRRSGQGGFLAKLSSWLLDLFPWHKAE